MLHVLGFYGVPSILALQLRSLIPTKFHQRTALIPSYNFFSKDLAVFNCAQETWSPILMLNPKWRNQRTWIRSIRASNSSRIMDLERAMQISSLNGPSTTSTTMSLQSMVGTRVWWRRASDATQPARQLHPASLSIHWPLQTSRNGWSRKSRFHASVLPRRRGSSCTASPGSVKRL